jgi:hypothetical protein
MPKGIVVCLTGAQVEETARALAVRLAEMGRETELIDAGMVKRLGGLKRAGYACGLLARHGVVAIATVPRLHPEGAALAVEVESHDTPEFAAEKVVDELAAAGIVVSDVVQYSPADEEQIRKRLADLGYIE